MNILRERQYKSEATRTYRVGVHAYTHGRQLDCILGLIDIADGFRKVQRVLDVPCGSGRIASHLERFDLTCADVDPGRLEQAKRLASDSVQQFDLCSIFDLPYEDASYQLILTILLVQHIADEELPRLFQEVARVTEQWAIVTYQHPVSLSGAARVMQGYPGHTLTTRRFDRMAASAGLVPVARRWVSPGLSGCVVVLLEKQREG